MAFQQNRYSFPSVEDVVYLYFDPQQKPGANAFVPSLLKDVTDEIVTGDNTDSALKKYYFMASPGMLGRQGRIATVADAAQNPMLTVGSAYTCFGTIYEGTTAVAYFKADTNTISIQSISTVRVSSGSINFEKKRLTFNWVSELQISSIRYLGYAYGETIIKIYRYVGREKTRKNIGDFDPITGAWDREISFNQYMSGQGFEYVETRRAFVGAEDRTGWVTTVFTNQAIYKPGLYADVWFPTDSESETTGHFIQYFRLNSKIVGSSPVLSQAWFDLRIFPSGVPFAVGSNDNYQMAVGVIPLFKNVKDPVNFLSFKALLSGLYLELTQIYWVEDEAAGPLNPQVLVWSGTNVFHDQVMNFFYGKLDASLFETPGTYSLHFRVRSVGTSMLTNGISRDFWKTIVVSRAKKEVIDAPVPCCLPAAEAAYGVRGLCSMVASYNEGYTDLQLMTESSHSILHEPRDRVEMARYQSSRKMEKMFKFIVSSGTVSGGSWSIGHKATNAFDPLLVVDRRFLLSDRNFDGIAPSVTGFYDMSSSRNVLLDTNVVDTSYRFAFYETEVEEGNVVYLGSVVSVVFDSADATPDGSFYRWDTNGIAGNQYFNLFFVIETNATLTPVRTAMKFSEVSFYNNDVYVRKDIIDALIPEVAGERLFKIQAYYSIGPRKASTTVKNIACDRFESNVPAYYLSRPTDLERFPVMAFLGNLPLAKGHDYLVQDHRVIEPLFTPTPGERITVYYGAK